MPAKPASGIATSGGKRPQQQQRNAEDRQQEKCERQLDHEIGEGNPPRSLALIAVSHRLDPEWPALYAGTQGIGQAPKISARHQLQLLREGQGISQQGRTQVADFGSEGPVERLRRCAGRLAIVKAVGAPQHHHAQHTSRCQAESLPPGKPLVSRLPAEDSNATQQQRQHNKRRGMLGGQQKPSGDAKKDPVAPQAVAQSEYGQAKADGSQQSHGQVGHHYGQVRGDGGVERQQ